MEVLEGIYGFVGGGDKDRIDGDGTAEIEELYRVGGKGDLDVEEGQIAVAEAKGVEVGKPA